jgi:hypothetical protein
MCGRSSRSTPGSIVPCEETRPRSTRASGWASKSSWGKAGCGTCHFAPLFNGATPPMLFEAEPELIGVPRECRSTQPDDRP